MTIYAPEPEQLNENALRHPVTPYLTDEPKAKKTKKAESDDAAPQAQAEVAAPKPAAKKAAAKK